MVSPSDLDIATPLFITPDCSSSRPSRRRSKGRPPHTRYDGRRKMGSPPPRHPLLHRALRSRRPVLWLPLSRSSFTNSSRPNAFCLWWPSPSFYVRWELKYTISKLCSQWSIYFFFLVIFSCIYKYLRVFACTIAWASLYLLTHVRVCNHASVRMSDRESVTIIKLLIQRNLPYICVSGNGRVWKKWTWSHSPKWQ